MTLSLNQLISSILRHDRKVSSYKIALIRAINDVALAFPDLATQQKPIALPLTLLAEHWLAYYWVVTHPQKEPVLQGVRQGTKQDIAFRQKLEQVQAQWMLDNGSSRPADGFVLINEMRVPRKRNMLSDPLQAAYQKAVRKICTVIEQPIRYAGRSGHQYDIFDKPTKLQQLPHAVHPPLTQPQQRCLLISSEIWQTFQSLSLWVEALCIHEWCILTERFEPNCTRGAIYTLLTERPNNRRPLTWERNQIDILLMEGTHFVCPWTEKEIRSGVSYDLDHLIPISIYPANELWNLVPSDPQFNQHKKRDRLPTDDRLLRGAPHLSLTYHHYLQQQALNAALREDVANRFTLHPAPSYHQTVTQSVVALI